MEMNTPDSSSPQTDVPDHNFAPANWTSPYPAWPPPPPAPVAPRQSNGLAIAALVLGITSLLFWFLGLGELAQVVLAITFGAAGMKRANHQGLPHKGLAVAGLVCGIVGGVAYLLFGLASLGIGFLI